MSSTTDKIKGYANEAIGNVKQVVGKAVGSTDMQVDGVVQERKGEAQQALGTAKDAAHDVADKAGSSGIVDKAKGYANDAIGTTKQVVGRAVGSPDLEAEGLAQEAKGEIQKKLGEVKKSVNR